MRRFGLGLFLIYVLLLVTPKLWADDDHHRANALEMGAVGLVAASVAGAGLYLVRRRGGSGK